MPFLLDIKKEMIRPSRARKRRKKSVLFSEGWRPEEDLNRDLPTPNDIQYSSAHKQCLESVLYLCHKCTPFLKKLFFTLPNGIWQIPFHGRYLSTSEATPLRGKDGGGGRKRKRRRRGFNLWMINLYRGHPGKKGKQLSILFPDQGKDGFCPGKVHSFQIKFSGMQQATFSSRPSSQGEKTVFQDLVFRRS